MLGMQMVYPRSPSVARLGVAWERWYQRERPRLIDWTVLGLPTLFGSLRGFWVLYKRVYEVLPPPLPDSDGRPGPGAVNPADVEPTLADALDDQAREIVLRNLDAVNSSARAVHSAGKKALSGLTWSTWMIIVPVLVGVYLIRRG